MCLHRPLVAACSTVHPEVTSLRSSPTWRPPLDENKEAGGRRRGRKRKRPKVPRVSVSPGGAERAELTHGG
ncbi:unnamed protein product [Pleuronectes platessa]|uniref:Uncharacterized protein n=1 Tax=Pleuronectes platessa TaxID=8262 RepID=A0A9N7Z7D8_PLEPL|nr:unnamed protein product [Pleuronectes platessa]